MAVKSSYVGVSLSSLQFSHLSSKNYSWFEISSALPPEVRGRAFGYLCLGAFNQQSSDIYRGPGRADFLDSPQVTAGSGESHLPSPASLSPLAALTNHTESAQMENNPVELVMRWDLCVCGSLETSGERPDTPKQDHSPLSEWESATLCFNPLQCTYVAVVRLQLLPSRRHTAGTPLLQITLREKRKRDRACCLYGSYPIAQLSPPTGMSFAFSVLLQCHVVVLKSTLGSGLLWVNPPEREEEHGAPVWSCDILFMPPKRQDATTSGRDARFKEEGRETVLSEILPQTRHGPEPEREVQDRGGGRQPVREDGAASRVRQGLLPRVERLSRNRSAGV
ncbi:hypothetical protein WMY93_022319 [Mugilogobius chulae]|uniref:Uncharacterized protein n=1 Tax=Mugilogobius chulae TaxID=88201 RepID=A0AAW0NB56_9GOBI